MTTYNTGNPIGSTDARDLYDNAQAFDEAVNSTADTFTDRLGNVRKPLAKAMQDIEIAGTTYATTAAGLAATTSGHYFSVPASSANDSLILYQNSGGTAVEVKRYPSAQAVQDLKESTKDAEYLNTGAIGTNDDLLMFSDPKGNVFGRVDKDSEWHLPGMDKSIQQQFAEARYTTPVADTSDYAHLFSDAAGNVIAGLKTNGDFKIAGQFIGNGGVQPSVVAGEIIILDTDIDTDCDDFADLAIAHVLATQKHCDLAGVVVCSSNPYAAPAAKAVNEYYGRSGLMVGAYKGNALPSGQSSGPATAVRNQFRPTDTRDNYPSSLAAYRAMLFAAEKPVTIVMTGFAACLVELLQSPASGVYPSGYDLIRTKVKRVVAVAGLWPNSSGYPAGGNNPEWNLKYDPANWPSLASSLPCELVWVGIELGDTIYVKPPITDDPTVNPVRKAFQSFVGNGERQAWGQLGVLMGVFRNGEYLSNNQNRGQSAVNSSTGANSWTSSSTGPHFYAQKSVSDSALDTYITQLLAVKP